MIKIVKICKADGCNNPYYSLGFCELHYMRWKRNGDLVLRKTKSKQGLPLEWLKSNIGYTGNGCLTWPFSKLKSGYAQIRFRGRATSASHVMCLLAHSDPVGDRNEAAHSCGNGHKACVNPRHLRWATRVENCADMISHRTRIRGESNWNSKIKEDDVRKIRSLNGSMLRREIGELFGLSQPSVNDIIWGRTWAHVEQES